MTEKTNFKDSALRALAILGLIAILLLGAWGIIQIAFAIPGFFGGIGNSPSLSQNSSKEALSVTAPQNATAGTPFTLSWNHQNGSGNYGYAVVYSCAPGLTIEAPVPTGGSAKAPCNTPFNFTNASASIQLTPALTGKNQVSTTITVIANNLATGAVTTAASTTLAIVPKGGIAATQGSANPSNYGYPTPGTNTYVPATAPQAPRLYGLADLAVSIVGTPVVSGSQATVEFVIQNIGTNVVPAGWTFSAQVPQDGNGSYPYVSPAQQKLLPGDKIVYTLGFAMPQRNYGYQPATYYPYSTYPAMYGNSPYPSNCGYAQSYSYNGVYNYPNNAYGCSSNYQYPYSNYNYSYNYGTQYPYPGSYTFSVTADQNGLIQEVSKVNNTASAPVSYSNY